MKLAKKLKNCISKAVKFPNVEGWTNEYNKPGRDYEEHY